jgi:hypothetical protein
MKRLFILLTALVALSSPSSALADPRVFDVGVGGFNDFLEGIYTDAGAPVADVEPAFRVSDLTLVDGVPLNAPLACWTWIGRTRVRHAGVGRWRDCVGNSSPPARSPDRAVRHRRADECAQAVSRPSRVRRRLLRRASSPGRPGRLWA